MKKIVYVTGCLGFIGYYVTKMCLEQGWYVKGVDKITYAADENLLKELNVYPNFSFIKSDINDLKFLYECDYIINCAAETHVGNSIIDSNEFIKSNINGVYNILELMKNYRQETSRTPTLIHFSTDEVYGDIEVGAHKETDVLKPSNPYSASKAAADMLIMAWGRTYNLPYIIVRPTNNYGIGQYVEKLIPKTVKYLNLGKKIPLHNNGTPVRNWLYVDDTANAIKCIINANINTNEIYNICGGFEQSNYDTVEKIIRSYYNYNETYINISSYLDLTYFRSGQDVRYALDDSKLRKLGWKPKANFDLYINEIVKYYKTSKYIW